MGMDLDILCGQHFCIYIYHIMGIIFIELLYRKGFKSCLEMVGGCQLWHPTGIYPF